MRDQVFISYSHKDKKWFEILNTWLKPLQRRKPFLLWDDSKIKAGQQWRDEIKNALASAKVAILLVSPDFLASDFIVRHELLPLLEAAKNDGLVILWIAIRKCPYQETEIERYQALNDPSRPLATLTLKNRDNELVKIYEQIKAITNYEQQDEEDKELKKGPRVYVDEGGGIMLDGEYFADWAALRARIESFCGNNACFIRQREVQQLFDLVHNGSLVILQGPRGAGKTAILEHVHLLCEQENIPVRYVDLGATDAQFQSTLWRTVVLALTGTDPGIMIRPDEVEEHLVVVVPQAVVCLDNIDILARNPRISFEREMLHLRALVNWLKGHHKSNFSVILSMGDAFDIGEHTTGYGSPWFTLYLGIRLAQLSEQRAVQLLKLSGISDEGQLAYCIGRAKYVLPLDLVLLAYLLKKSMVEGVVDYEFIGRAYVLIEPLLRK